MGAGVVAVAAERGPNEGEGDGDFGWPAWRSVVAPYPKNKLEPTTRRGLLIFSTDNAAREGWGELSWNL